MKLFRIAKEKFFPILLVLVPLLFFYQTIFFGKMPFPGDLLVGEYAPYNSYPFLGYTAGSYPNKAQNFDAIELLYPAKFFSIESLKNIEFPLWNPYIFSGTPHLASLQSGSFYPFNFIFFIFPFSFSWSFYIFIQPVLAGIFTYIFLRELKLGSKSSFFGSFIFAFSSFFVVWLEYGNIGHSIIWLPLLMFLLLKFLAKPGLKLSFAIILSLTFSLLAGYIQTVFYIYVFLFLFALYNIFQSKEERLSKFLKTLPLFIYPLFLTSFQLLPTFELLSNSTRASYPTQDFFKLLIPKVHIATLFAPDFFGNPATRNYWLDGTYIERVSYFGIVPLILGLFAMVKRKNPIIFFFTLSFLIPILLSFDTPISKAIYSLNIPFISNSVPTRIMFVSSFSAAILAAFGFEFLEKSKKWDKNLLFSLLFTGSVFVFLWLFVFASESFFKNANWLGHLSISKRNLLLPSSIFFLSLILISFYNFAKKYKGYVLTFLILLSVFDLFYFFQKITPFSPKESVYPKTDILNQLKKIQGIDRSWGYGSAYIESNIQTYEKIFSADGYDALHDRRYAELVSSSGDGKLPKIPARSEAEIIRGFGDVDLRNNNYRQNILDLLGVKYILHKAPSENAPADYKTFNESIYEMVWSRGNWQIYKNRDSLERISLFGNYIVEENKDRIIKKIHSPEFDLRDALILEENLPPGLSPKEDINAKVKIESYEANKVVISTSSDTDNLLFVSDTFYPGWKAKIDESETKIYRANYALRAVAVPKGEHLIVFSYFPDLFDWGLKLAGGGILILVLISASKASRIRRNITS
mgnify:CR=1 FL=1